MIKKISNIIYIAALLFVFLCFGISNGFEEPEIATTNKYGNKGIKKKIESNYNKSSVVAGKNGENYYTKNNTVDIKNNNN